ncbi:MAG: hypothetical protein AAGH90_10670 [Pseudomonadota bacterium]
MALSAGSGIADCKVPPSPNRGLPSNPGGAMRVVGAFSCREGPAITGQSITINGGEATTPDRARAGAVQRPRNSSRAPTNPPRRLSERDQLVDDLAGLTLALLLLVAAVAAAALIYLAMFGAVHGTIEGALPL